MVIPLTDKQADRLKDKENITINIHNSSKNIRCPVQFTNKEGKTFAIISLDQQMVNFINNRFIDVVIIMEQNNGLKIPNTSITKKKVYKVPIEYLSNGSDSTEKIYFNVKQLDEKGDVSIKQKKANIYKKDDKFCYVDPNDFASDAVLVDINSNSTLSLSDSKTDEIAGVYCVNQGVATFRYIDIQYEDDEYTIINDNVPYSIAWYDRIVLNQSFVKENQIIK